MKTTTYCNALGDSELETEKKWKLRFKALRFKGFGMEKLLEKTCKLKWKLGGSWEYVIFMVAYFLLCKPTNHKTADNKSHECPMCSPSTHDSKNEGGSFSCSPKR